MQANVTQQQPQRGSAIIGIAGFLVAATGLLVLLGIVAVAIYSLPDGTQKAQNVVAIATSGFGVVGAIVGAYFGVRAAGNAVEQVVQSGVGQDGGHSPPDGMRQPSASS